MAVVLAGGDVVEVVVFHGAVDDRWDGDRRESRAYRPRRRCRWSGSRDGRWCAKRGSKALRTPSAVDANRRTGGVRIVGAGRAVVVVGLHVDRGRPVVMVGIDLEYGGGEQGARRGCTRWRRPRRRRCLRPGCSTAGRRGPNATELVMWSLAGARQAHNVVLNGAVEAAAG